MKTKNLILQTNPKASYLACKSEIDSGIHEVLDSGWYILGQEVEAFEQEFAAYIGVNHAIGVANGTDALEISLRACNIGIGDAVITVSHTAVATVAAIELVGATPILVDIDPITFTLDVNSLEAIIQEVQQNANFGKLKAIIPVHLYGHPVNMAAILEVAERYGLYIIEDCAQSHGATIQGRKTGSWGHLAAFSFYPTKNLGALGDGGAVTTNQKDLAEKVVCLRQYGWRERFISDIPGMNTRLDPLQAAILRVRLRYLDQENQQRQYIAQFYDQFLANLPLQLPHKVGNIDHVYHQYVIQVQSRDGMRKFLSENSIGTAIHYPAPVHLQPAYQGKSIMGSQGLPITEQISPHILSLPMHAYLKDEEVETICEQVKLWYSQPGSHE